MKPVEFIEKLEGNDSKRLGPDLFGATWDPYGKCWNIGPGLTKGVTQHTEWAQAQIDAALAAELAETEKWVDNAVKVPLGENQRTVLISFAYNIGVSGFLHSSVLSVLNAGHYDQVPARLTLYVYAKGVRVQGLINRRNQEIALWRHPDDHPPLAVQSASSPKADPQPSEPPTPAPTLKPTSTERPMANANLTPAASSAGVNTSNTQIVTTLISSVVSSLFGVGSPLAILMAGSSWGHYVLAAATLIAGIGSAVAPVIGLVAHNTQNSANTVSVINSLSTLSGQIASNVAATAAAVTHPANPTPATMAASA